MFRDIVWVDFETGGVEPHHSPLSFAMIHTQGNEILGEWYTEIREEPLVVSREALLINKVDLTAPGLTFAEFRKQYNALITKWCYTGKRPDGSTYSKRATRDNMPLFGGQNTFFDRPILHRILNSTWDGLYYHRIDTMVLANALRQAGVIDPQDCKLATLASYFNLTPQGTLHNALTDVKMTFSVYLEMQKLLREITSRSSSSLLDKIPL